MAVNRVRERMARIFTAEEAADYLRQMADALEQGKIRFDETELEVEGAVEVKGALKSRRQKTSLKLKLKFVSIEDPETAGEKIESDDASKTPGDSDRTGGRLPYKKLKKIMGGKFKGIRNYLKNGAMPSMDDIDSFYLDCETMVDYPDKGDEYYVTFMEAANRMVETARSGDLPGLTLVIEEMGRLKKDCHDRYK